MTGNKNILSILWSIIIASLSIHFIIIYLKDTYFLNWTWVNIQVHSSVEISGSLIAFLVALTLVALEKKNKGTSFNIKIASALVGMGWFDTMHAFVNVGNVFVWLHSMATLTGGLLFATIWLPEKIIFWKQKQILPLTSFIVFIFAFFSIYFREFVPQMVDDNGFTLLAKGINVAGGLLFFIASSRLIYSYYKIRNLDDLLFFLHCSLFGLASIMFEQSEIWDLTWWGWHILRFLAYGVALWFVILSERRSEKEILQIILKSNDDLEAHVTERTKELELAKENTEKVLSDLRSTQGQLVRSEKMASMGILTAGLAHEINNPLNSVNVGSVILKSDFNDISVLVNEIENIIHKRLNSNDISQLNKIKNELDYSILKESIRQTLEDVLTSGERIAEIIQGLQNFSRIHTDEKVKSNIHQEIDKALAMLSSLLRNKVDIVKNYDRNIGEILCYPNQLVQVFLNILDNSAKAIEEKGTITIFTENVDSKVRVVISDNGIGMTKEVMSKIFDPFFTTKEIGKGTGLGLSICHGIINNHNGRILVESEVGSGSKFIIELPKG